MRGLFAVLVSAAAAISIAITVLAEPILQRRNNCACPSFDLGFFPLSPRSGVVNGELFCVYPDTDRCVGIPQTTGALAFDDDYGLCPNQANGGICPPADRGNYCLGIGSTVLNNTLICTYPTLSALASNVFHCNYTTGGTLVVDADDDLCPTSAVCAPTPTISTQIASCTVTPTRTSVPTTIA